MTHATAETRGFFWNAYYGWVVVGGITQILATFLLVYLFSFRNFAVGTGAAVPRCLRDLNK